MPTRDAATVLLAVKAEELALAKQKRISAIDPTSWFCTATLCPLVVSHTLLYHDDSHMTKEWARFIAPVVAGAILPIIGHA